MFALIDFDLFAVIYRPSTATSQLSLCLSVCVCVCVCCWVHDSTPHWRDGRAWNGSNFTYFTATLDYPFLSSIFGFYPFESLFTAKDSQTLRHTHMYACVCVCCMPRDAHGLHDIASAWQGICICICICIPHTAHGMCRGSFQQFTKLLFNESVMYSNDDWNY